MAFVRLIDGRAENISARLPGSLKDRIRRHTERIRCEEIIVDGRRGIVLYDIATKVRYHRNAV